ncbi:MAG: Mut7-C RNAse domain-containing protein [Candidatus Aminicenantes bacterium]|jgi:uncharacterized protein with PIN domain
MRIRISFHGDLKDLLKNDEKDQEMSVEFPGKRSVKDLVQSLGIPHTEIGKIRIKDQWIDSSYVLHKGDTVEVFPVSAGKTVIDTDNPGFICDVHLWKLARRLRLLGFDTRFNPQWDDAELADLCHKEHLVLLSRDRGLLKRNKVVRGLLIRNTDPEKQVSEVLHRLQISAKAQPLTRCLLCNGLLEPVSITGKLFEKKIKPQLPPNILEWCKEFHFCPNCEKAFWKGSHYKKLSRMIDKYLEVN